MIRRLIDTDIPVVVEMGIRAWTPVFPHIESSYGSELYGLMVHDPVENQRHAIDGVCRDDSVNVFVAENDNAIVGFAAIKGARGDQIAEVYMIAVDPGAQRHGIARQLMEASEQYARENGISIVMVETGADEGHGPARELYSSCGYHHVEVARYFKIVN